MLQDSWFFFVWLQLFIVTYKDIKVQNLVGEQEIDETATGWYSPMCLQNDFCPDTEILEKVFGTEWNITGQQLNRFKELV